MNNFKYDQPLQTLQNELNEIQADISHSTDDKEGK
jgi:hypothetical protein